MKTQVSAIEQQEDRLLTDRDVCEYLQIRPRQLFTWRMEGLIPYFKIGKAVRFRKADIDAALAKLRIGNRPDPVLS